jgi:hypothetical protein
VAAHGTRGQSYKGTRLYSKGTNGVLAWYSRGFLGYSHNAHGDSRGTHRVLTCSVSCDARYLGLLNRISLGSFVPAELRVQVKRTRPCSEINAAVLGYASRILRVGACAAPTPAPTNVGDTNPPTRAPTRGPNFADPTGTSDARGPNPLPSLPPVLPFPSRAADVRTDRYGRCACHA